MRNNILWRFFSALLFYKHAVSIRSSFCIQESVRRLSKAANWPFPSLIRQRLFGRVSENAVKIRRVIPFVGNSFAPVFYGSFQECDGVTILEGYYSMSLFVRIYNGIWFGFCLLMMPFFWASAIFGRDFTSPPMQQLQLRLIFVFAPIGMMFLGAAFVRLGRWFARNDEAWIEERISRVLSQPPN